MECKILVIDSLLHHSFLAEQVVTYMSDMNQIVGSGRWIFREDSAAFYKVGGEGRSTHKLQGVSFGAWR